MDMKTVGELALRKARLMPGNVVATCSASGDCREQAARRLCASRHFIARVSGLVPTNEARTCQGVIHLLTQGHCGKNRRCSDL